LLSALSFFRTNFEKVRKEKAPITLGAMARLEKTDDPNSESVLSENWKLKMLKDAIEYQSGKQVVFQKSKDDYYAFGYIDHQSVGECDAVWDKGIDGVIGFVCNPESYFETDNDNH
jgi:hypothetical protein